jgi:hypothetical protein
MQQSPDQKYLGLEETMQTEYSGMLLRGKLDGLFTAKNGKVWLMEHKTKSMIDEERILKKLQFDFQIMYYLTLLWLSKSIATEGILYNQIRKPGLKLRVGDTLHSYKERIFGEIVQKPEYYFQRYDIRISQAKLQNFICNELVDKLEYWDMLTTGILPAYPNQACCDAPFKCGFLDMCAKNSTAGYRQGDFISPELDDIN